MAKVLFVGGTGEISFACAEASVRAGHQVSVFNRGNSREVLPSGVELIIGDIANEAQYSALASRHFDTVCQFIAYDTSTVKRDIDSFAGNCNQYIFISTASAYQKPWHKGVITEETPLNNPFWEYSRIKAECEALLWRAHADKQFPVTIIRPSHTYRKRLPGTCFPGDHMAWRILHDRPIIVHDNGESLWTLTHADDFARAFVELFGNAGAIGEDFHITNDNAYSWNQIVKQVSMALGHSICPVHVPTDTLIEYSELWRGPLKGDKANSLVFDNSKLKTLIGDWHCTISLETGLAKASGYSKQLMADDYRPDKKLDSLIDRIVAKQSAA
ncbi:MAG: NAD-dependent epimerase/dehydratase family protein [Gammaproteobacteria bacterium]|nr:NAD-dependent epimerase/dehydratase family protein [Gammaproteobacteria bacterium]MDD9957430.1 NAD-dependent epimerase/dehydratase family protein [Gammaproteobacteria bacterium]